MYVVQSSLNHSCPTLHELDKKTLRLAKHAYPHHEFRVVSGAEAHRWVRDGGHHSTPLYLDQGRIRYARDAR
jgi:hypothetical protein